MDGCVAFLAKMMEDRFAMVWVSLNVLYIPWSTYSVCTHFIKPFRFEDCLCGGCQASHFRQIYLQISIAFSAYVLLRFIVGGNFPFLPNISEYFVGIGDWGHDMVLSQVDHLLDGTGLMCAHINTSVENAEVLFDVTPTNAGSKFLCRNRCKPLSWSLDCGGCNWFYIIEDPRDWKGWTKFSRLVLESHVEKILGKLDRDTEGQNVLTFGRLLELLVCNVFDFSCEWMQLQHAAMTTTRRINNILYFRFCEMNLIRWVS